MTDASSDGLPRVLCVDDEPNVLASLQRALRGIYAVSTADSGTAAVDALLRDGPFAVVLSDLRMPGMTGIELLRRAREHAPDTARVLLTGQADVRTAIAAVNEGSVFRFLAKPCTPAALLRALEAAAEQYRLVTAERVLLEQTLHGCVKALTDILAQANPVAFSRGVRARDYAAELVAHQGIADGWQVEIAAMLSQVGCVSLPPETVERIYRGQDLSPEEQALVDRLPAIADALLAGIPRLEEVRAMVRYQAKHYDGGGIPDDRVRGERIPWGARALKVVLDFDALQEQGMTDAEAIGVMRDRAGWYDPEMVDAFGTLRHVTTTEAPFQDLLLRSVRVGMVFVDDVRTRSGALLIARGQEVTVSLAERLRTLALRPDVVQTVRVSLGRPMPLRAQEPATV
jgi:response regulator RpfG family c-di-GMP phosphodiesterase